MRKRHLWPLVLAALLALAMIKGGIYRTDYKFRHKHNEAPATVEEIPK